MKKLFALLLAAMLVVSLAACGEDVVIDRDTTTPKTTAPSTTAPETSEPEATQPDAPAEPMGTVYVAFSATMELVYDKDGNALEITGTNEIGKTIADATQKQVGKGCVFALRSILRYASDNNLLGDAKSMSVRVGVNDPLPKEDFLEEIQTDCQYLADEECTGIHMKILAGDKLNDQGNLTLEAAKELAARHLNVKVEELTVPETSAATAYSFICGNARCIVDIFNGAVTTVTV